ncbi:hypothetical protein ACIA5G_04345 [Amycolatopsis sp. NPDC051758]|uniref:hypothetical protein n=1 Tax=Amycolatopsis sp. NPDC051758 TaxID=3363935 RepID=UPI003787313E
MHQPKKDHTVLIALSVLAAVTLLGAAFWLVTRDWSEPRAAPLALPVSWPSAGGEPVRQVPMPTGELAVALPSRTSGHVLCGAIPEQTWASVLGGPVLREVDKNGNCHVVSANVAASATLWADPVAMTGTRPEPVTVAGRQGSVSTFGPPGYGEILTLRLSGSTAKWTRPSLQLIVNRVPEDRGEHDFRGMALSLAGTMIGAITTPGPALPADGESREMTPIPGSGITDAPYPFITWQLCTQLSRALGVPLGRLKPGSFGSCRREEDSKSVTLAYHDESDNEYFPDRVAGRPAKDDSSGNTLEIQLLDDSRQTLEISWLDSTKPEKALADLAEKVVPPLLGR